MGWQFTLGGEENNRDGKGRDGTARELKGPLGTDPEGGETKGIETNRSPGGGGTRDGGPQSTSKVSGGQKG